METKDFYFDLPEKLIAQKKENKRGEDRLLVLDRYTGKYIDSFMNELPSFLDKKTVMVINNSKVRKARTYALSSTGAKVEFLFLKENDDNSWISMVSKSKRQKVGKEYAFLNKEGKEYIKAEIIKENADGTKNVKFITPINEEFFSFCGHIPLPPYIKRKDTKEDEENYQTIYAKNEGSVACPTAGLHFTNELLSKIKEIGVEIFEITLHVGLGTFLPVRSKYIEDHNMHQESFEIKEEVAEKLNKAKKDKKKILSVGTTSLRTLESASNDNGVLTKLRGDTSIFIYPGYKFKFIDELFTNFHTPESTLLMLVSALAGKENILSSYNHAIEKGYKFFSYGDAMLIKS